ncbi:MAG: acyl-CoA thioesterase [Blastocatellia bacterium]
MSDQNNHEWSETRLRVRYAETDQAGIVYHSNYLVWFEIGRVELCRDHGFNYRDMEREAGAIMSVTEARVTYRKPALYDDILIIRTRLADIRSRALRFVYEVRRAADDILLAEGETGHIVIDTAGRARSIPAPYAARLRAAKTGNRPPPPGV